MSSATPPPGWGPGPQAPTQPGWDPRPDATAHTAWGPGPQAPTPSAWAPTPSAMAPGDHTAPSGWSPPPPARPTSRVPRWAQLVAAVATLLLLAAIWLRPAGRHWWSLPGALNTWCVVAAAIWLQALPFVVLGTLLSATIAAWLKPRFVARFVPRSPALAVPVAGLAGIALPGCECASVPTARRLVKAGVPPAAALTFLLAAPAVNPVVLVATAVAYTGRPSMVLARFVASLAAALIIGWLWTLLGRRIPLGAVTPSLATPAAGTLAPGTAAGAHAASGVPTFRDAFVTDLVDSLSYLVIGSALAATLKLVGPVGWLGHLATNPVADVLIFGLVAVLVALCSEADAFMAASLTGFSPTAQLAFMVVGPMVDVKLMAMQQGAFGGRFVRAFAPLTFVVCALAALLVGQFVHL